MKWVPPLIAAALLLGAATPLGDAARGAAIVAHGTASGALPCMACHGPDLTGNASIGAPRIAGLKTATTLGAFQAIADGRMGQNYVMKNIAHALTSSERDAVADYLAGLPQASP
ncbi:MAG: c-type cytochrome [Acidiphilium sp.]|nr:c-type cytochrome [Acidiphilium sp.]MDD4934795.1 c-type cytochrome [Acidiphilium sp.]